MHTNSSKSQLRKFFVQEGTLIAFSCMKLTRPHKSRTVTEKELLIIIKTLKSFPAILLGQCLKTYSDNKT